MRLPSKLPLFILLVVAVSCSRSIGTTYMADPQPLTPIISNLKYPPEAIQKKLEGKVVVAAFIDTLGNVAEIKVESSTEPIFNDAALDAVRKTKFEPAIFNGRKVAKWFTTPIKFSKPVVR
jgi:periplasmic protein TonB